MTNQENQGWLKHKRACKSHTFLVCLRTAGDYLVVALETDGVAQVLFDGGVTSSARQVIDMKLTIFEVDADTVHVSRRHAWLADISSWTRNHPVQRRVRRGSKLLRLEGLFGNEGFWSIASRMYTELRKVLSQQNIFVVKIPIKLKLDNWIGKNWGIVWRGPPEFVSYNGWPTGGLFKPCVEAYLKLNCENPCNEDPLKGSFKV